MSQKVRNFALLIALAAGFAAACDAGSTSVPQGEEKPGPGEGGDIKLPGGNGEDDIEVDPNQNLPPTANCADSTLDDDEVCDDGNMNDGDGCYGNCRGIEKGFICPKAGEPCLPFAVCGDGLTAVPEQCDDGGIESGDGCSKNCKLELGLRSGPSSWRGFSRGVAIAWVWWRSPTGARPTTSRAWVGHACSSASARETSTRC
jgi:cysteine-rich repeat protein